MRLDRIVPALLLGCTAAADTPVADDPTDFAEPGPWAAGQRTLTVEDTDREHAITVEVWTPIDSPSGTPRDIVEGIADPDRSAAYQDLLDAAPPGCPTVTLSASPDASPSAAQAWPLVVLSHCHECTRFNLATVAEHLASHGVVVAAPEHDGNTLFDRLEGTGLGLDGATLALRVADLGAVLDAGLAGDLGVTVDPDQVVAVGHSFGAVTAAALAQERQGTAGGPRAAAMIGAPAENPLLRGVDVATLDVPQLYLLLEEDHSILEVGNALIESNHAEAPGPAWLVRMADAGHWSPSDLVGLTEGFLPGCGDDTRMATGEPFTYLAPTEGKRLTGGVLAAWLDVVLKDGEAGATWLDAVKTPLTVARRGAGADGP